MDKIQNRNVSQISEKVKSFLSKQIDINTIEHNKKESEFTNVFDFHHDTNKAKAIIDTYNGYLVALNKSTDDEQFVFQIKIISENRIKQLVEKRATIIADNMEEITYYKTKGLINGLISAEKNINIIIDEIDVELAKINFSDNVVQK